ncbi:BEACH domain-containing protein C2-like [Rutidosis leptorrhynchoides]|uniref:BEACH domain-containing protein C2-like n=1 Tax=Rutidosis leptorrhynchoides TaxID=125765 RepID=UPI003A98EB3C
MDDEKEEIGGERVEKPNVRYVKTSNPNNVSFGTNDVDAMLEQACLDRDKELDNLLIRDGEDDDLYGFHDNNGTLEFDSSNHNNSHIFEDPRLPFFNQQPRSPFFNRQSSFFTSSPRHKQKTAPLDINTEILNLVDSAIMDQPESIEIMKNMVSGKIEFEDGVDSDSVADLLVDTLLKTMGGVESFDDDDENNNNNYTPTIMKNSKAAIISGEILPWLPWLTDSVGFMSPRTRLVSGLRTILRSCTRNRAMCCSAGLIGVLLQTAEKIFLDDVGSKQQLKWNGYPLCSCLQYLAGHSVSVTDLRTWLHLLNITMKTPWALRLMASLEKALSGKESRGPKSSFEFDGESSGLLGPGEGRWPFPNGYAIATWIFIELLPDKVDVATNDAAIAKFGESKSGKFSPSSAANQGINEDRKENMPRLFNFISSDNQGIEAYFNGQNLGVESGRGKTKKGPVYFSYEFKPQWWYFIGLEHTSNGELRLYIDGVLHETRPFDLPKISKPLSFFCIGTNPPPTMASLHQNSRQRPLFAEIGPIYIFKEPIGPELMGRLASRGADSLPSFGNAAGLMWLSTNAHVANVEEESARLDADISGYLHIIYHPSLLNGRHCADASPSGPSGMLQRPAEVLGHVPVTTRMRPTDALWALAYGGPMSLIPFVVSKVNNDTLEPQKGSNNSLKATTPLAAPVFRIISVAIQHLGNSHELCRIRGPEVLSKVLTYLLKTLSSVDVAQHTVADEEIVAAVVSLCQSQKNNVALKMQLFSTLLLDLKIWSLCSYGIQKKLLSSLADIVFVESSVMHDAKAIHTLLDGCRRCYWTIREKDSMNTFSIDGGPRPIGEVNALVDELLVVIELLLVAAPPTMAVNDIRCLLGFLVDCPQPNQVARVLHLIYRLVLQPNTLRAKTFAEAFISRGGIETLLVLLQREAKIGDNDVPDNDDDIYSVSGSKAGSGIGFPEHYNTDDAASLNGSEFSSYDPHNRNSVLGGMASSVGSRMSASESLFIKNLGGISFSISAENARNNVYNIDKSDGIVVAIIGLFGALIASGHLKLGLHTPQDHTGNLDGLVEDEGTMFDDKVSLLHFALQKTLQAAPNRLMTANVYTALLSGSLSASARDEELNFYDPQHRFEHLELLLILLRSLPYSTKNFQTRALQDLLILACSHSENRNRVTMMEEWPEWLLELLISNHEMCVTSASTSSINNDVEDLIHNFLIIMLEPSMREKDGWKDIEATLHCAEWLSRVGGSSTGEQRARREKYLPVFKRRLFGDLLDYIARDLRIQIQVIAAASSGVASYGLPPEVSKAEIDNAAQYSGALIENASVMLMLVEDHIRLQSKLFCSAQFEAGSTSPLSAVQALVSSPRANSKPNEGEESFVGAEFHFEDLASMVDNRGDSSSTIEERLAAAAGAEPYENVSCAFVCYGSCMLDLASGWKYRSRLFYGVGQPSKTAEFCGGGSGWDSWKSCLEKDSNGKWVEIVLVKKCVNLLQALLLDEPGLVDGIGMSGASGTGMGGKTTLYQLLDNDQPFLCMLRMTLLSLREDEGEGENGIIMKNVDDRSFERLNREDESATSSVESSPRIFMNQPGSALLWSVLSPILHIPVSESKRQRVLVASCVIYSEVWHAVSRDRLPLRKQYLEAIVPPLVAVIRRWRPLLAKIPELTPPDGYNPLSADDPALDADATPMESALAMISPGWAAAFASPTASWALNTMAAGTSCSETTIPTPAPINMNRKLKHSTLYEKRLAKLQTRASFQEPSEASSTLLSKEKFAKSHTFSDSRGMSAVAMATSGQRRGKSDMERLMRCDVSEAMGIAWMECLQSVDTKSEYGRGLNALYYKFIALLVRSLAFARNMQRYEVGRRALADSVARRRLSSGISAWRKLIHYLIESDSLFGLLSKKLCDPKRVFWKLDYMESSSRMHRFLRRDFKGSDHCSVSSNSKDPIEIKQKSTLALKALSSELANEENEQDTVVNTESYNDEMWLYEDIHTRPSTTAEQHLHVPMDSNDPQVANYQDFAQSPSAAGPDSIPSEHCEIYIIELHASMVRPLKVRHGIFQITNRRINFVVDKSEKKVDGKVQDKDRSWLMASLHQVHSRRYLLRRSALEIFMLDRSNFFFDFGNSEARMSAYRAIIHARPPRLNNIYLATQRPEQLLKRTQLMERWSRWEISNFEYLMQLNTLAGRTYNDITQYPVFPWVLSDYKSTHLDLANPSSYRDLSKPVGALNEDRLKKFQEKFSSFNDPFIPKYHYDSHYSTAGTVLYYLMRVEPFTTLSIRLQGGKFEDADRMFSDIAATWNGVLEDMSDVKELVPEMFYLPEILTNENSIDFGTTKNGDKLDSVKLPPWADNPVDFMHKHQMALESEHVSAHLHEWIDLIFGYKQQGKEAISANNVFFYVTYDGAVCIDKIQDPVHRCAVQDQVAYFGQTPSRLLAIPHIKKMPLSDVLHMQTIYRNPKEVKQYLVPSPKRCNLPASAIHATSDALVIVNTNAPSANIALHKWHPNTPDGYGTPFMFQPGKNRINSGGGGGFMRYFRGKRGSGSDEWKYPQAHAYAASGIRNSSIVSITYNNEVVTGGHVDNSIRLVSPDGAKTLEIARAHCAPVTCLSLSPDSKYLVSGSRDTTVLIWRIHRSPRFRSGSMSEPPTGTVTPTSVSATTAASCFIDKTRRRRIEGPVQVIRGHLGEITDCCVNSDLGAVASCSYFSDVLVHSVSRGRLLKRLHGVKADIVRLSKNGVVLTWNDSLHVLSSFTLNGILISQVHLPFSCYISCMEISFDGRSVLVGLNSCSDNYNDNGVSGVGEFKKLNVKSPSVCLLDLHTLKIFHTMRLEEGQDITAMTTNKDDTNLLVSTSDKQLIVFADPAVSYSFRPKSVKFTTVVRRAGSGIIGLPRGTRQSRKSLASVSSDDE